MQFIKKLESVEVFIIILVPSGASTKGKLDGILMSTTNCNILIKIKILIVDLGLNKNDSSLSLFTNSI